MSSGKLGELCEYRNFINRTSWWDLFRLCLLQIDPRFNFLNTSLLLTQNKLSPPLPLGYVEQVCAERKGANEIFCYWWGPLWPLKRPAFWQFPTLPIILSYSSSLLFISMELWKDISILRRLCAHDSASDWLWTLGEEIQELGI